MSGKEKLLVRLLSRPKDFSFDELVTLMGHYGYYISNAGKTSGSRVIFFNRTGDYLRLHKPHPGKILKRYQLNDIIAALSERSII